MEPTAQAERLAPSVRQALADLRAALDGATASRRPNWRAASPSPSTTTPLW